MYEFPRLTLFASTTEPGINWRPYNLQIEKLINMPIDQVLDVVKDHGHCKTTWTAPDEAGVYAIRRCVIVATDEIDPDFDVDSLDEIERYLSEG